MRRTLDEYVIKGREAAEKYKRLNKKTVEKISFYDPKLKLWTFKRITTDENAVKFHENKRSEPKIPTATKTPKKITATTTKPKPKPKPTGDRRNSLVGVTKRKVLDLVQKKKTVKQIAKELQLTETSIRGHITTLRKEIPDLKVQYDTNSRNKVSAEYLEVKRNYEEGYTTSEIAIMTGRQPNTISYHYKRIATAEGETWKKKVKQLQIDRKFKRRYGKE